MADTPETVEDQGPSLSDQIRAARAPRDQGPATSATPPEDSAPPSTDDQQSSTTPPPWGDDFDAARAWNTIQAQREEVRELRARETAREREQMTELERTKAELAETQEEVSTLRLDTLRSTVVAAKGLPAAAMSLLNGCKDKAEMESRADELLTLMGGQRPPDFGNGARPPASDGDDFSAMIRRAAGRPA